MSSIWGSRFQTTATAAQTHVSRIDIDTNINDVLATLYESLPEIPLNLLRADKSLGTGTMFHVRRETFDETSSQLKYYVAVKYMRLEQKPDTQRQIIRSLLRELRTITHPLLRGHPHVISAFGYGWTHSNSEGSTPFLVLEYADYGTLSEVLQATELQRHVTIRERHHLALDVACGLQALHQSGIIHGDLKTSNILACQRTEALGYTFGPWDIPWVAKIADFGSSLTREEADEHVFRYTGTALYNAPEIESIDCAFSNNGSFVSYKAADVYSFGLVLWEVMKIGRFYLESLEDDDVTIRKKRYREFLCKKHGEAGDALLDLAVQSLQDVGAETAESYTTEAWKTIEAALALCLRREPSQRGSSIAVYKKLRSSASDDRPPVVYSLPRMRSLPPTKRASAGSLIRDTPAYTQLEPFSYKLAPVGSDGPVFRAVAKDTSLKTESRLIPFYRLDSRRTNVTLSRARGLISLQRIDMAPRPPREVQRRMVKAWEMQVKEDGNTEKVSEAYMELSACHLLGFGVEQDLTESLSLLRNACRGSRVAKAIFARVSQAINSDGNLSDNPGSDATKTAYFSNRLLAVPSTVDITPDTLEPSQLSTRPHHQKNGPRVGSIISLIEGNLTDFQSASAASKMARLDQLWEEQQPLVQDSLSQIDISAALNEACKMGVFEIAKVLASMCVQYIGGNGEPTPLHWLINFPPQQAQCLAELLVCGPENEEDSSAGPHFRKLLIRSLHGSDLRFEGICRHCINAQSSCGVFLPAHCMELVGAPLHWAVRCRNQELTRKLLDLGAKMSLRCKVRSRLPGEPPGIVPLNYNALDIALEYHLYDIAEDLLNCAKQSGKPAEIGASLLARTTTTFSRFVIHGPSYRLALKKTIRVLINAGWYLERADFFNEVPLLVALRNCVEEKYVIEELLQVNPNISEQPMPDGMNLATLVVLSLEADCSASAWKLEQILPLIKDPNASDDSGRNALHYCAIIGNARAAKLLLSTKGIDINARDMSSSDKHGSTPLMHAARFGRTEVVQLLLEADASADFPNNEGVTALEIAVIDRQFDAASLLIQHGASIDFRTHNDSIPRSTVLHAACIQGTGRPALVKRILHAHTTLQTSTILNQPAGLPKPKTPLYEAVMFADLESVEALLQYGADPDYWWHPPDLDPSNPNTIIEYKCTPHDLVRQILRRALSRGLHQEQLRVALQGTSDSMRGLPFLSESEMSEKRKERAEWESNAILPQFSTRLEDIQEENQGQAGVRNFIARLKDIERLFEDNANSRKLSRS